MKIKRTPWIRATKTTIDGEIFDSAFEAKRYQELKIDPEVMNLQRQYVCDCVVNGVKVCRYTGDFYYENITLQKDKSILRKRIIEETKGYWTDVAKLRFKLAQACFPEIEFREIRMKERESWQSAVKKAIAKAPKTKVNI